jgi:hypothetical protein
MPLDDQRIDKLIALIQDSFRVREDHEPIYVDVGGHLQRIAAAQHQIVFGRRGSGKSCLLVHYHRNARRQFSNLSLYILADEIKTLPYPDLLLRLLLTIFEKVSSGGKWFHRLFRQSGSPLRPHIVDLRQLLDEALTADVEEDIRTADESELGASISRPGASVGGRVTRGDSAQRTARFVEKKLDTLERHLLDYKEALKDSIRRSGFDRATVLVDDFYLIPPALQPDVIDYLHRLLRGTPLYLKAGTVRHRTSLIRRSDRTVGVELYQDVEEINLDRTFEDIESTRAYLSAMLDEMGHQVGIPSVTSEYLSPDGLLALTLASGGVPRDFLTIFVQAIEAARARGSLRWLTPTTVYKGAGRVSYRTKLSNLRSDAGDDALPIEVVFRDLTEFCLREKRRQPS